MLNLKLFGPGQALYGDQSLTGFPAQNPCLLLCYLALYRHVPHQRDRLAAIFWAERPMPVARKCLRHVLWRLCKIMATAGARPNHYLSIEDETISFHPQASYLLDVEIFETITTSVQGVGGKTLSKEQAENIERATKLYSGDLLEDTDADWCLHYREYLRLMYMNSLEKLMIYHAFHENYEHSLTYGTQILAHDNTREAIHQHIMWLHWVLGNRHAAVAQYKLCVQILQEEMGIGPMEQTQQLYKFILQSEPTLAGWNSFPDQMFSFSKVNITDSSSPFAHELLQRIHHLQSVVEQSSKELNSLESLVSQLLPGARQF